MEAVLNMEMEIERERKRICRLNWLKGIVYISPALILFFFFVLYPFARTIVQSLFLSDKQGRFTSFAALDNYLDLLQNSVYLDSIGRTFLYTVITVPFTIVLALLLAVLSGGRMRGMGIYRTVFASTMGISVAAGSMFWNFLFHPTLGLLNSLLKAVGMEPVGFLTSPAIALPVLGVISVWMNLGFSFLVLAGGIKNIDSTYYESVEIVGGGFWYRLFKVTIPLLSPSLFFVLVVSVINAFQTFGVIDMLTQGGPMNGTRLFVYGLYQEAFVNYQYGLASAQGVVLFLIIFLVSMVQMKLTERWVTYQ